VSDPERWKDVCESERSVSLDAASVCRPLRATPLSPIDNFYAYISTLVPLGTEEQLSNNDALGKALMLGIVSATEHYFRSILSGLIHACPVVRGRAASQTIPFGALGYYSRESIGLAIFEHVSLADAREIQKLTSKLLGFQVEQENSAKAAFLEFDKLCQIRHAAIHSRGDLSLKNLQELGIAANAGNPLAIHFELSSLHASASICQNVVRAYNRLAYRKTVEGWIGERLLTGNWAHDKIMFAPLFELFHSRKDARGYPNSYLAHRPLSSIIARALSGAG